MLYEAGHNVLPNNMNPLRQGWVAPPTTMDGIPAPLSITVNPEDTVISKVIFYYNVKFLYPSKRLICENKIPSTKV